MFPQFHETPPAEPQALPLIFDRAMQLFPSSPWSPWLKDHLKEKERQYIETLGTFLEVEDLETEERLDFENDAKSSYNKLLFAFCRYHGINLYDTSEHGAEAFRETMEDLKFFLQALTEPTYAFAAMFKSSTYGNPLWGAPLRVNGDVVQFYHDLLYCDFTKEDTYPLFTFAKAKLAQASPEALRALYRKLDAGYTEELEALELLEALPEDATRLELEKILSANFSVRNLCSFLSPRERTPHSLDAAALIENIKCIHTKLRSKKYKSTALKLAHLHGIKLAVIPLHAYDWNQNFAEDIPHRTPYPFLKALRDDEPLPQAKTFPPWLEFICFLLDNDFITDRGGDWHIADGYIYEDENLPPPNKSDTRYFKLPQTEDERRAMQQEFRHAEDAKAYYDQALAFIQTRDTLAISTLQRHLTHSYNLTKVLVDQLCRDGHLTPNPDGSYTVLKH